MNAPRNRWRWERYRCMEKERAARRFRHHVQTPANPGGRVARLPCAYCRATPTEAHHPDHQMWWIVVWVCTPCHRRLEYGSLTIRRKHLCDYSSLILPITRRGAQRPIATPDPRAEPWEDVADEVPF